MARNTTYVTVHRKGIFVLAIYPAQVHIENGKAYVTQYVDGKRKRFSFDTNRYNIEIRGERY